MVSDPSRTFNLLKVLGWIIVPLVAILLLAKLEADRRRAEIPLRGKSIIETNPEKWHTEAQEHRHAQGLPPLPPFDDTIKALPPNAPSGVHPD